MESLTEFLQCLRIKEAPDTSYNDSDLENLINMIMDDRLLRTRIKRGDCTGQINTSIQINQTWVNASCIDKK